jgi:hypothetical protein
LLTVFPFVLMLISLLFSFFIDFKDRKPRISEDNTSGLDHYLDG